MGIFSIIWWQFLVFLIDDMFGIAEVMIQSVLNPQIPGILLMMTRHVLLYCAAFWFLWLMFHIDLREGSFQSHGKPHFGNEEVLPFVFGSMVLHNQVIYLRVALNSCSYCHQSPGIRIADVWCLKLTKTEYYIQIWSEDTMKYFPQSIHVVRKGWRQKRQIHYIPLCLAKQAKTMLYPPVCG